MSKFKVGDTATIAPYKKEWEFVYPKYPPNMFQFVGHSYRVKRIFMRAGSLYYVLDNNYMYAEEWLHAKTEDQDFLDNL